MPTAITLGNTIGASFLGLVGAAILYGITALQTFIYFLNYPADHVWYKVAVGILWLLDTLHIALSIHGVYHYLIIDFGQAALLETIVWSLKLQIVVNIVIIMLVQGLYAARIWSLGRHRQDSLNKYIRIPVIVIVVAGLAVGISLAAETYRIDSFLQLNDISWAIYASFVVPTVCDFIIAFAMCAYLQQNRSQFHETNSTIGVIISYIISSGLVTSACSVTALLTFAFMPSTLVFLGIEFLLTKLYINSFLAMLNARKHIRRRQAGDSHAISELSNIRSTGSARVGQKVSRPVIHVETVVSCEDSELKSNHFPSSTYDSYERGADEPNNFVNYTSEV